MKSIYRAFPVVLAVGLLGCNQSQPVQNQDKAPSTQLKAAEPLSKLPATAPTLKVATTGTMPPFSFQDEYGNMQGIDIDAIRAIGETQGFKVQFYKETWQNLFASVEKGRRDLAISGISYSDERAQKYGLSDAYFFNPSAIMYANPKLTITGLADLKGLRVGGMAGSKQVEQVQQMGGASEVITTPTTYLLFGALMQDKVDAIVQDQPLLQYTAVNHADHPVTIVAYENESNPAAQQVILMAKDNTDLIANVNAGIAKLKANNAFKKIEEKWLAKAAYGMDTSDIAQDQDGVTHLNSNPATNPTTTLSSSASASASASASSHVNPDATANSNTAMTDSAATPSNVTN